MTLNSPIKELSLLQDGILATLPPQRTIPAKVGMNELLVTAPGHGIRKLRFWLKAGEQKVLDVALQKSLHPIDPVWESPEKLIPEARLKKRPSVCVAYKAKVKGSELCNRETWLDDLTFSEPGLFPVADMQSLAASQELTSFRSLANAVFDTEPETTAKIEDFYSRRGELVAVKQLAALHNIARGDCPRVHALYVEATQVMADPTPLAFFKGLCAELRGKNNVLEGVFKAQKNPPPYLAYHYARGFILTTPAKALQLASSCLKTYRFDVPCQELGLMAAAAVPQKDFKVQKFTIEDGAFRALLNLETSLPKKQFEAAFFTVIPLLQSYPQSLEAHLFLAWINAAEQVVGGTSYFDQKLRIATPLAGPTLEKAIEDLEKFDMSQLLIPVYRLKIKGNPSDPNLWIRLIRVQAKTGQCEEVLASLEAGSQVLPRYSTSLLQTQASCLVELQRYPAALETLLKILELKPNSWSSYYNLGALYERIKKKSEAIQAFKKALELQPTPEARDDIQFRLLELEREDDPRPAAPSTPASPPLQERGS